MAHSPTTACRAQSLPISAATWGWKDEIRAAYQCMLEPAQQGPEQRFRARCQAELKAG